MTTAALRVVGGMEHLGDEELRQWFEEYLRKHEHLPTAVLSRSDHIGVSRIALDAYVAGTYFLSKEMGGMGEDPSSSKLESKIREYRELVDGTTQHNYQNTFLETRSWQQFQHACNVAISEKAIVIVYARPGTGKSRCLKQYSIAKMQTRPIEILCSANITTRYFVQKIARSIGVSDVASTARLEDLIVEKLKPNPRPLFVDQANYLHEKALGTICYLWETARIPIVLLGTKDLVDLFNKSSLTEDVRAQLTSRIAMHYPLVDLSLPELKTITERVLGSKATPAVVNRLLSITSGNHRHLDMVLPRLAEMISRNETSLMNGELQITELVEHASSRLMGI